jgi:hypothetical protein
VTRTSSSGEPAPSRRSREPRVESAAIYALVAGLRVHTYDDLLAPHWAVAEGAEPAGPLDVSRFLRSVASEQSHVLVALPAPVPVEASDAELATAATRTVALVPAGAVWDRSVRVHVHQRELVAPAEPGVNGGSPARGSMNVWLHAITSWAARPFAAFRAWWRVRLRG